MDRAILAAAFAGAALLHGFVPRDPVGATPMSAPSAALLSGGRTTMAATLSWGTTVLHYANTRPDPVAMVRGIEAAHHFDPSRQAPLSQGALMVRRAKGDPTPILENGLRQFPDEPWFPWAIGMHHWLDRDDAQTAAEWMDRAAQLAPEASYRETANALRGTP